VSTTHPKTSPHGSERSRRASGERRVEQILAAAVQVFGSGGPTAVTHRAVADAAGVPLGSTTYYFKDRDDLMQQTMRHAIDVEAKRLTAIAERFDGELTVDASVGLLTQMFFDKTVADPLYDLALFEMFLEATRNPSVRSMTQDWTRMIAELTDRVLPPTDAAVPREVAVQIVAAVIDGLMLEETSNQSLGLENLSAQLRVVISRLVAAGT
jgi:DNA-binding transcriptional regulator YbjK